MKKLFVSIGVCLISLSTVAQVKFKLTDTIGKWNQGNLYRDSLKQEFIQQEITKKINAARVKKGMKPLISDIGLKPAAVHNAIYNRYCFAHDIHSTWSYSTMTHFQNVDIPNFTEIVDPWARISLLDRTKFAGITENLTLSLIMSPNLTFQQVIDIAVGDFAHSLPHWESLTEHEQWDAMYVYYDLHTGSLCEPLTYEYLDGTTNTIYTMNTIVYVILGDYK